MSYGENDLVMFSDDIAETIQVEHPKNATRLQLGDVSFELETLIYKNKKIKKIKAYGSITTMFDVLNGDQLNAEIYVNNCLKETFDNDSIEEFQIDNITTNCSIIINLKD